MQDEAIGKLALLVYRLIVKAGLKNCLEAYEASDDEVAKDSIYDSMHYSSAFLQVRKLVIYLVAFIYFLHISKVTHEEDRNPGDAFKRTATALYLTHHLRLAGFFKSVELKNDGDNFYLNPEVEAVVYLMLRHLQSCSCNAYEIAELVRGFGTGLPDKNIELGGAVYTTVSLSNHSCAPNTTR